MIQASRRYHRFTRRALGPLLFVTVLLSAAGLAQSPRFVIDDDEYAETVSHASAKLLHNHKLMSLTALRRQVHSKGYAPRLAVVSRQRLATDQLYERLRQSTLAIGTYYKCPDCGNWHFDSSTGFVVGEGGVVCTCCHVVITEDKRVKESYLVAADSAGHVFPVLSVLGADTEADTCFLKIDAPALKPLPLRAGARTGERVYCLSHPGGYYFMFTEGLVSRLNSRRNDALDERGQTNGLLTRPILFLNVTAEFAPGSSGAPIADDAGNVVGQVASITDAGESDTGDDSAPASPSVPVRFCTASEEILRLTEREGKPEGRMSKPETSPKREIRSHGAQSSSSAR